MKQRLFWPVYFDRNHLKEQAGLSHLNIDKINRLA